MDIRYSLCTLPMYGTCTFDSGVSAARIFKRSGDATGYPNRGTRGCWRFENMVETGKDLRKSLKRLMEKLKQ